MVYIRAKYFTFKKGIFVDVLTGLPSLKFSKIIFKHCIPVSIKFGEMLETTPDSLRF
jgi:hypothetical protein